MATDKLLSNIEVLIDAPCGIVKLRDLIRSLGVSGALNGLDASTWRKTTIGSEVKIVRGITFPASAKKRSPGKGLLPCLRTANIQDEVVWDDLIYVSDDYLKNVDQFVVVDDLLISMANSRELVGKVALVRRDDIKCTLGGFIAAIRCGEAIRPNYLLALLRLSSSREKLMDSATQTTNIANISLGRLRPFEIFLPSLEHQDLIVLKIEELMALCDQLEEAKNQRDNIRTAARESAINAISTAQTPEELDAAWRRISDNWSLISSDRQGVALVRRLALQELLTAPFNRRESWVTRKFGELGECRLGKMLDRAKNSGPFKPYLRNTNVQWFRIDLGDIAEMQVPANEIEEFRLRQGDLLICEGGQPGRCAIVDDSCEGLLFQKALHRFRPNNETNVKFVAYWLMRAEMDGTLSSSFTGVTIRHLTGQVLKGLNVSIPNRIEQDRIVDELDKIMLLCDELERNLLSHAELSAAFASTITRVS